MPSCSSGISRVVPGRRVASARGPASPSAPGCPCPRRRRWTARSLIETTPMRTGSKHRSWLFAQVAQQGGLMNWNSSRTARGWRSSGSARRCRGARRAPGCAAAARRCRGGRSSSVSAPRRRRSARRASASISCRLQRLLCGAELRSRPRPRAAAPRRRCASACPRTAAGGAALVRLGAPVGSSSASRRLSGISVWSSWSWLRSASCWPSFCRSCDCCLSWSCWAGRRLLRRRRRSGHRCRGAGQRAWSWGQGRGGRGEGSVS
jgi:hypothetical protein